MSRFQPVLQLAIRRSLAETGYSAGIDYDYEYRDAEYEYDLDSSQNHAFDRSRG